MDIYLFIVIYDHEHKINKRRYEKERVQHFLGKMHESKVELSPDLTNRGAPVYCRQSRTKWLLLPENFSFLLSIPFNQRPILAFHCRLLFPEVQTDQARVPSDKAMLSHISGNTGQKIRSH
jgi:hypothetical protein